MLGGPGGAAAWRGGPVAAGPRPRPPAAARGAGASGGGRHVSARSIAYLEAHQGSAKYLVAATGSQTTAPIIIATGKPVVTIGGFNGGDPAPTVAQLADGA